jgi:hypothetical protein
MGIVLSVAGIVMGFGIVISGHSNGTGLPTNSLLMVFNLFLLTMSSLFIVNQIVKSRRTGQRFSWGAVLRVVIADAGLFLLSESTAFRQWPICLACVYSAIVIAMFALMGRNYDPDWGGLSADERESLRRALEANHDARAQLAAFDVASAVPTIMLECYSTACQSSWLRRALDKNETFAAAALLYAIANLDGKRQHAILNLLGPERGQRVMTALTKLGFLFQHGNHLRLTSDAEAFLGLDQLGLCVA